MQLKMQLTICSGVELVARHDLAHQLAGRREDRLLVVALDGDRAAQREAALVVWPVGHGADYDQHRAALAQRLDLARAQPARLARRPGGPASAARSPVRSSASAGWPTASNIRRTIRLRPSWIVDLEQRLRARALDHVAPARARCGPSSSSTPLPQRAQRPPATDAPRPARGRSSRPRSAGASGGSPARRRSSAGSGRSCRRPAGPTGYRRAPESTRSVTFGRPCGSCAVETTPDRLVQQVVLVRARARPRSPSTRHRRSVVHVAGGIGRPARRRRARGPRRSAARRRGARRRRLGEVLREPHRPPVHAARLEHDPAPWTLIGPACFVGGLVSDGSYCSLRLVARRLDHRRLRLGIPAIVIGDNSAETGGGGGGGRVRRRARARRAAGGGGSDVAESSRRRWRRQRPRRARASRSSRSPAAPATRSTDAGTSGQVGPVLDQVKPDKARVLAAIKNGGLGSGTMPANIVTGKDAQAVATTSRRSPASNRAQQAALLAGLAAASRAAPAALRRSARTRSRSGSASRLSRPNSFSNSGVVR